MAETPERRPNLIARGLSRLARLKEVVSKWPKWARITLVSTVSPVLLFVLLVLYANFTAVWAARGLIHDEVGEVPKCKVAVVFGTTYRVDGNENPYFRYRIEAAEKLWKAGKVETLIVSGDNRTPYYNEPEKMRQALLARGIPDERIVLDPAGLRTLDSVVRAKKIYGADKVLFVSQRFQIRRAIYLAKANDIEALGFAAEDVKGPAGYKTRMREVGAKVKMWLDVNFLDTQPETLGEREEMPE